MTAGVGSIFLRNFETRILCYRCRNPEERTSDTCREDLKTCTFMCYYRMSWRNSEKFWSISMRVIGSGPRPVLVTKRRSWMLQATPRVSPTNLADERKTFLIRSREAQGWSLIQKARVTNVFSIFLSSILDIFQHSIRVRRPFLCV